MGNKKEQLMKNFNKKSFETMGQTVKLTKFKLIKHSIPQLSSNGLNASFLPINKDIALPDSTVIPLTFLESIIKNASHRVIIDFCPCRTAMECKNHSRDIGCLMMGQGAREIDPSMGHEATIDEALEHAKKAVNNGLVPLVGKSLVENMVFGISKTNRDKFFVACFCCECCCLSRFFEPLPAELRQENLMKLDGLKLEVETVCTGCGICAEKCFMKAIQMINNKAVIGNGCLGCGRCASVCPNNAIKISITDSHYIENIQKRLKSVVDEE